MKGLLVGLFLSSSLESICNPGISRQGLRGIEIESVLRTGVEKETIICHHVPFSSFAGIHLLSDLSRIVSEVKLVWMSIHKWLITTITSIAITKFNTIRDHPRLSLAKSDTSNRQSNRQPYAQPRFSLAKSYTIQSPIVNRTQPRLHGEKHSANSLHNRNTSRAYRDERPQQQATQSDKVLWITSNSKCYRTPPNLGERRWPLRQSS